MAWFIWPIAQQGKPRAVCALNREESDKAFRGTAPVARGQSHITANAQGLIGVAQCHFQKSIAIYDHQFAPLAKQNDFLINDAVGFDAPGDVQAGESGDFYGLDQNRNRILRIDPAGRIVAVITLPGRD